MDFTPQGRSLAKPEFHAVIIAGFGQRLDPLTNDHGEEPCPKALLPIGNKPMISYPLTWLEESGIKDVMIICAMSHSSAISHYLQSDSTFSSLHLDIQTFEDSDSEPQGACDVLRKFADRIQTDFILLACDFIAPQNLPLSVLLNQFRLDTSGITLTSLFYEIGNEPRRAVDEKPPIVVYDERSKTLLHINTDDGDDDITVSMRILTKYPSPKISNRLIDSHVYVCRRTVLDALSARKHFHSIRHDLIPWLCKVHYHRSKRELWETVLSPNSGSATSKSGNEHMLAMQYSSAHLLMPPKSWPKPTDATLVPIPMTPVTPVTPFSASKRGPTSFSSSASDNENSDDGNFGKGMTIPPSLRCGIVVHRLSSGYAGRANLISTYFELNRQFLVEGSNDLKAAAPEGIDPKAQISSDSMIGSSTRIGERTTIKKSVIGRHCIIGKNVRVISSVIMDHVEIADGSKVENCILSRHTRIGEKAQLKDCESAPGSQVLSEESRSGEQIEADMDV